MYDTFFVSYDEPDADENWRIFSGRWPHARRVHGITGISNAHRRCAELSYTRMFWTVDADTVIDQSFLLDFAVPIWDRQYVHLWYSRNPVNGLEYGYGAVKLWPRQRVLDFKDAWLDFTTTVGMIKIMPEVVATTRFNVDAYSAWKSGFRETVKLCRASSNGDEESAARLRVWLNVMMDVPYAEDTVLGARSAYDYYKENRNDAQALLMINDFKQLQRHYKRSKKTRDGFRHEVKLDHV
jgi:hypothetical protein